MMANPIAGRSFIATFGLVFLAIAGLFAADTFLAKTDRAESRIEATRLFQQGQALMAKGDSLAAVGRINDALAIERGNNDYLRVLAEAQLAAGENSDSEATLTGLLNTNSTNGPANLLMARVLEKEGRGADAVSFFHRAIYGVWKQDPEGNRRRARLELIDLLAQQNSKEELLAELLPIQDWAPKDAPQDLDTRTRLGDLFLRADAPSKAADVFRGILHQMPGNVPAHRGLGQSEFAQGDYRAAQRDFQAALRISPDDAASRHWLDLCDQLLQLDPTLRGLSADERWRRSVALVEFVQNDVGACLKPDSPPELQELAAKADAAVKAHVNPAHESEASEANLDLAEQLWQVRKKECQPPASNDSALALVLKRLAR
jgi:tetratricopeptide (TPR) repeat protein